MEAIYTPVVPFATAKPEAYLSDLTLSQNIEIDGTPINEGTEFAPGAEVVFVSFSYMNLSDGVLWRHIWLRNGNLYGGGTSVWEWGWRGRTYFWLKPQGGFVPGDYQVQLLIDEEVVQTADFTVKEP
jgi:hypothetical protein